MTDRNNYLTVALEHNMRDDDTAALVHAIRCLRFVLSVKANVADEMFWVAEERAKMGLRAKLIDLAFPHDEVKKE